MARQFASVEEYIASFPGEIQPVIERFREIVRAVMSGAEETISYNMPTFVQGRHRVYFAAWKAHIALYAVPVFEDPFEAEVAPYRAVKDTVHFRYKGEIPYDLVTRIVQRLAEK